MGFDLIVAAEMEMFYWISIWFAGFRELTNELELLIRWNFCDVFGDLNLRLDILLYDATRLCSATK